MRRASLRIQGSRQSWAIVNLPAKRQSLAPPSGCGAVTLANDANAIISAGSQVVLGPGFTANAANTSTSLLITLAPPSNVSVSPSSGSGATQNFTFTATSSDWGGAGSVQAIFNWGVWGSDGCYLQYSQSAGLLYLYSLTGGWLPLTPGSGSVSNSYCTLNGANSSASVSGSNLSVTFALTFNASFLGPQNTYMVAYDASGGNSGWQQMGTWTGYAAPYAQPPTVAVSPTSGTGMGQTFTFTSTDLNGAAYMPWEYIFLGSYNNPGCTLAVYHVPTLFYFAADDGTWNYVTPGSSASNSQCTINAASGSNSGNNWTYTVSVAFTASYAGVSKPIYLEAFDHANQTNGVQQVGSWTVATPPAISGVSPNSAAAGASVTIAGTNFGPSQNGSTVTFNGTAATPASWSGSSIVAPIPSGATTGNVVVTVSGAPSNGMPFTVIPPDFTITLTANSPPATAMIGRSVTFTVAVNPAGGFNGAVILSAPGLPTGASASFSPATITGSGSSTMTVTAPATAGNIAAIVTGTSGSLAHNASAVLAVQDFSLAMSPAYPTPIMVAPNGQVTVNAFTGSLNGFGGAITLTYGQTSIGGLTPCSLPGADWSGSSTSSISVAPGQQATLILLAGNANQYYCTFQVTASYGGVSHVLYGYVIQQGTGGIILTPPSQQTAAAGQTASFPVPYTPYGGFTGSVAYSVSGNIPSGATASFAALSSPQQGDALNVYAPPGTLATTYGMLITASSPSGCTPGTTNCVSQTVGAQLVVQSGLGFSITATPLTATTIAPGGTAQYNITVNGSGGYTGQVNLSTSGGPSNASVTLSAYSVQAGGAPVTLTVATTANTPLSTYSTVVTGTSGSVSQYGAATLIVTLPVAASMLTPPPGANIAGGNTTFTWNAGLGATQYTVTATAANGQTFSATTGPGQLSATLSLPATSQTAAVTLQTMTAGGPLTQYYSYTIQPSGTAQPLTLAPGNTMPNLVANGQEALYTFTYNSSGGARPSPLDIGDCVSTEVAIRIRIASLTAGSALTPATATLGFTAPVGTAPTAQFDWLCDDGDGPGSGGGGTGSTGDPTPSIDSVTPVPLVAGTTTQITINGEYFGTATGYLDFEGGCSQVGSPTWDPSWGEWITVSVSVDPGASGYCTVSVNVVYDDSGDGFLPGDGSSAESEPFPIALEGPAVAAQMSCIPAVAVRGAIVTCGVSGVSASAVSGWSFSGNGVVVNGPAGALVWYGTMVSSGTVTATVNGTPLSQAIMINPRAWHVNPAQPTSVANGALQTSKGAITLPVPPVPTGSNSGLGASTPAANWKAPGPTVIRTGPNVGFAYYVSPLTMTTSSFLYEINPDLLNQNSTFSQYQCGSNGFISWANLLAGTQRHEYNSNTESHWAFYMTSMNANNIGDYFETQIMTPLPGADPAAFNNSTVAALSRLFNQVLADSAGTENQIPPPVVAQPYPVNYSAAGAPLGNINYGPNYVQCN